jgi:threonine synthase
MFFGCPTCAKQEKRRPLEVKYAINETAAQATAGLWRWASLLPPVQQEKRVTLYEGSTPLIPIHAAGSGANRLFLKNETVNPTWSWKDRPNAVSVSVAKQFGFSRVVATSTGNHGNALAAYATAAEIDATILCNDSTPELQLALMEAFGARVIRGGNQDKILTHMITDQGYFPCTILCPHAGYSNPFGVEGFKTIAFEIAETLGGKAPDRIFIPVGSGDGVYGIWKGFRELAERHRIPSLPKIVACQPHGANSASRTWHRGRHHVETLPAVHTSALSVAEPLTGDHALRSVYESGGEFREASESQIAEAAQELRSRGFALELASALPYACLLDALSANSTTGETWVVVGSGAAVKWPETIIKDYSPPISFTKDIEEITLR